MQLEKLLEKYHISNHEAIAQIKGAIEEFKCEMTDKQAIQILWDESVNQYYQGTRQLKTALSNHHIKENITERMMGNLDKFMDMCQNPEFHIAFVGAIKAGKSTLINALLGQDLASTAVTPETASLTKFKGTKGKSYIKLSFYTEEEWQILWNSVSSSKAEVFLQEYHALDAEAEKNNWINKVPIQLAFDDLDSLKEEIKKWTSSKKATHYFVKEVEVGLAHSNIPEGVVYVDTPGLDDPVKYRSDITRAYIDRANAVLVCVKSDALTGGELATIYSVFANSRYNPEKIYVIGTQLDTLNRPAENWKEQQEEWLKHLSKVDCFGDINLAKSNLVSVAAYLYNLVLKYDELSEDDIYYELEPITRKFRVREIEKNLDLLIEHSRIDLLKSKLNDEILVKHKRLLTEDIASTYEMNKKEIINVLQAIKQNQEEILALADADISQIQAECANSKAVLEQAQTEKLEMERALKQIRTLTEKRAEDLYHQIKGLGGKAHASR